MTDTTPLSAQEAVETVSVTLPKDDYENLVRDAMRWRKLVIDRDAIARAIWESYWPDQNERWVSEHWEANAKMGDGDRARRVPYILADVVIRHLESAQIHAGWQAGQQRLVVSHEQWSKAGDDAAVEQSDQSLRFLATIDARDAELHDLREMRNTGSNLPLEGDEVISEGAHRTLLRRLGMARDTLIALWNDAADRYADADERRRRRFELDLRINAIEIAERELATLQATIARLEKPDGAVVRAALEGWWADDRGDEGVMDAAAAIKAAVEAAKKGAATSEGGC